METRRSGTSLPAGEAADSFVPYHQQARVRFVLEVRGYLRVMQWRGGVVKTFGCEHSSSATTSLQFPVTVSERVLTTRMIKYLENDHVWTALRYVVSAMVALSKEWPGVLWEDWPVCTTHPSSHIVLAPPAEVQILRGWLRTV